MPRNANPKISGQTEGDTLTPVGDKAGAPIQDYAKTSTKALYIAAISNPASTKAVFKVAGNLKESGQYTLSDNNWHEIRWDGSVQAIVLKPVGEDLLYASTKDRGTPSNYGSLIADGAEKMIKVAGARDGAIFIKRNAATSTVIHYDAYGDVDLLNAPDNIA